MFKILSIVHYKYPLYYLSIFQFVLTNRKSRIRVELIDYLTLNLICPLLNSYLLERSHLSCFLQYFIWLIFSSLFFS